SRCFVLFLMAEFSDAEALVRASHVGHEAAVRLLLGQGVSPCAVDTEGRSALSLASKAGHSAVVRLLAEHLVRAGAFESECPSALVLASSHGRKEVVRELLGARADVESRSDGLHPLAAAAAGNHFATVSALLSANASINATSDSATPLLWAASSGCNRVLLLLIGARADVQCPDEDGGTPLIWAAAGGHDAAVAVLLQAGASLNVGDHSGRTALSWAASHGHEAVMKADAEVRDCNGMSPQVTRAQRVLALGGGLVALKEAELSELDALDASRKAAEGQKDVAYTKWTVFALSRGRQEKFRTLLDWAKTNPVACDHFERGKDPDEALGYGCAEMPETVSPERKSKGSERT
ncbi:unnamed protein product, partial [Durusdinium trenchii]